MKPDEILKVESRQLAADVELVHAHKANDDPEVWLVLYRYYGATQVDDEYPQYVRWCVYIGEQARAGGVVSTRWVE